MASFRFIDLFAGIGGIRTAFERAGGECVFSSEWDKFAQQTYEANFGEKPFGDICQIAGPERSDDYIDENIPDHDVLTGGFPCQPFSLAGVSKKNSLGRKHGFEDETQGTLFFDIARILKVKRPKAFFLENVKNLKGHDKGNTFAVIMNTLKNDLEYTVKSCIVDAEKWLPQHRERIFIVGYDPEQVDGITEENILIPKEPSSAYKYPQLNQIIQKEAPQKYTLGPGTWDTLERHKAHHKAKGNGFGYGLHKRPISKDEVTRTISARYHKDGAEILIETDEPRPRRLTIPEAMQLQGFDPASFNFPVSDTQAYRQIGNSVAIPAVAETAKKIELMLR